MYKLMSLVYIVLMLTACGGADNTDPTQAEVTCGDLYNDGQPNNCGQTVGSLVSDFLIGDAHAATIDHDAGDVSRSQLIIGALVVNNPLAIDINGYVQIIINDAGCNGATSWDLLPKQQVAFLAGKDYPLSVGGSCGDMPLGVHHATVTAWDADGETVLGKVNITFNTIE